MLKITVPGRVCPKKNSPRMVYVGGKKKPRRSVLLPSESWIAYRDYCEFYFWQIGNYATITGPVRIQVQYWLSDKRWKPDLVGILQSISDILEYYKVIENDRQIESYDGSRPMGLDKDLPRCEIEIHEI